MSHRRFRLKTLMIVVFLSSLVLGTYVQASRMDAYDWTRLRERSIFFLPFLVLIVLKLGLVMAARARRSGSGDPSPPDEGLP